MHKLHETIEAWGETLVKRDLSPKTIREYKRDVGAFFEWLAKCDGGLLRKPFSIGMTTAREYRDFLRTGHKKPASINRSLQSLAQFLVYLDVPEKQNPFKNLRLVKSIRSAPISLDRNDWHAVRRAAESLSGKDKGLSLAIVSLLRHAGLRVSELVALITSDIEIKEKSGHVLVRHGKGLKERVVPLNLDAREGLKLWLESRGGVLEQIKKRLNALERSIPSWVDSEFIFVGQRGILTTRGVGLITEKLGRKAGLEKPLGTHRLRHTFARAALDPKGYKLNREPVPLTSLRQLLGHSRIETTAIYTQFEHKDHARFLEEEQNL